MVGPTRTAAEKRIPPGPMASPARSTRRAAAAAAASSAAAHSSALSSTPNAISRASGAAGQSAEVPAPPSNTTSDVTLPDGAETWLMNLREAQADVSGVNNGAGGSGESGGWNGPLPPGLDRATMDAMDILVGQPGIGVDDNSPSRRSDAHATGSNGANHGIEGQDNNDLSEESSGQAMVLSNIMPVPEPMTDEATEMAWVEVNIKRQDDPLDPGACTDIWAPIMVEDWGVESEAGYLLASWPDTRLLEERALVMMAAITQGRPRRYLGLFTNFRIRGHPDARRRVALQPLTPGTQRAQHRVTLEWTPTPEVAEQLSVQVPSANNTTGSQMVMTVPDLQLSYVQNMQGRPEFGFGPVANRPAWAFYQKVLAIEEFSGRRISCPEIRGHRLSGLIPKKTLIAGCGISYSKFREHVIIFKRAKHSSDPHVQTVMSGQDQDMLMGEFLKLLGPQGGGKALQPKALAAAAAANAAAEGAIGRDEEDNLDFGRGEQSCNGEGRLDGHGQDVVVDPAIDPAISSYSANG